MGLLGSGKTTLMNILDASTALGPASTARRGGDESVDAEPAGAGADGETRLRLSKFKSLWPHDGHPNVIMPLDYAVRRLSGAKARRLAEVLLDRVGLGRAGRT